jgi:hypothetical protein
MIRLASDESPGIVWGFLFKGRIADVRDGSIASVLRCPRYVRLAGNFGNAGLLLMASPLT